MRRTVPALVVAAVVTIATGGPAAAGVGTDEPEAEPARIDGVVFLDLDGDGDRARDEPGRVGVTVTARDRSRGDATTVTTTTDVGGRFVLELPSPGRWWVGATPPPGLSATTDAPVRVEAAAGTTATTDPLGVGTSVGSGADLAVDVHHLPSGGRSSAQLQWSIAAHNLGDAPVAGPVRVRLVLDGAHEVSGTSGDVWSCDTGATVATCELDGDLAAARSAPVLRLVTGVGTPSDGARTGPARVTATVRGGGGFDASPLNDEDSATATVVATATGTPADEDDPTEEPDTLAETGATPAASALVAALGALLGVALLRRPRAVAPDRGRRRGRARAR